MHLKGHARSAADARWQHQSEPAFFPGSSERTGVLPRFEKRDASTVYQIFASANNLNQIEMARMAKHFREKRKKTFLFRLF
jgi:hypothetical protein